MKRIFSVAVAAMVLTSCATVPTLSDNTQRGWGFRKMSPRPEFTAEQQQQMDSFSCLYMGNEKEKVMYLTFDEGYENGYTSKILDVLKEKNVPAAFFVTGAYLKSEEKLVSRMLKEGHIVGNHSLNHPSLPQMSDSEIEHELYSMDLMLFEKFGTSMEYLRAPRGEYSTRTLDITQKMGYKNVFWSLAYVDWKTDSQRGADYALKSVTEQFHNGAVILLHAVSADNAAAMGAIIDAARAQGYEFKSLKEYKP